MSQARSGELTGDIKGKIERVMKKTLRSEGAVISTSAIGALAASNDASVTKSVSFATLAGHDALLQTTSSTLAIAGHDLKLSKGGAEVMLVAGDAHVERGFIGVLVARKADLTQGSRVLMTLPMALGLGAVAGAVFALVSAAIKSRQSSGR